MADGDEDIARVVPLRPRVEAGGTAAALAPVARAPVLVSFNRVELSAILRVYGRMVAAGEWRDYAIDHARDDATFSIYRRMGEVPLYRVVKSPRLARRQGAYAVVSAQGLVLKRGHELETVLKLFDKKRHLRVVGD